MWPQSRASKPWPTPYPLYSKSDQVLLGIGDAYAGEAHNVQIAP
jgi:hypothetical protein